MASTGTVAQSARIVCDHDASNPTIPGGANQRAGQVSRHRRLLARGLAVLIRPTHGSPVAAPASDGRPQAKAPIGAAPAACASISEKAEAGGTHPRLHKRRKEPSMTIHVRADILAIIRPAGGA